MAFFAFRYHDLGELGHASFQHLYLLCFLLLLSQNSHCVTALLWCWLIPNLRIFASLHLKTYEQISPFLDIVRGRGVLMVGVLLVAWSPSRRMVAGQIGGDGGDE